MTKATNIFILLFIITGIIALFLYIENQDLKWEKYFLSLVPDIELTNTLVFNSNDVASGSLTGFVAFVDPKKQPKDTKQYIQIEASTDFIGGKQVFYLTDMVKMNALSIRNLGVTPLLGVKENGIYILTDGHNNFYLLYLLDSKVFMANMTDAQGDKTNLITTESDFKNFMGNLLESPE